MAAFDFYATGDSENQALKKFQDFVKNGLHFR